MPPTDRILDESYILGLGKRFLWAKRDFFLTLNQVSTGIGWLRGFHIVFLIHTLVFCEVFSGDLPLGFNKISSTLTSLVCYIGVPPKMAPFVFTFTRHLHSLLLLFLCVCGSIVPHNHPIQKSNTTFPNFLFLLPIVLTPSDILYSYFLWWFKLPWVLLCLVLHPLHLKQCGHIGSTQ